MDRGDVTPVDCTMFELDYRQVVRIIHREISECDAVICLVGFAFGHEPRLESLDEHRKSYTQLEYEIAKKRHKPTYVFLASETCPLDDSPQEDAIKAGLQERFRAHIRGGADIYYQFSSMEELLEKVAALEIRSFEPIATTSGGSSSIAIAKYFGVFIALVGAWLFLKQPKDKPVPSLPTSGVKPRDQLAGVVESPPPLPCLSTVRVQVDTKLSHEFVELELRHLVTGQARTNWVASTTSSKRIPSEFSSLPCGNYALTARLDDRLTQVTRSVVAAEGTNSLAITIDWVQVAFETDPRDAVVRVENGAFGDMTISKGRREQTVRPGWRLVSVARDGFLTQTTNILVDLREKGEVPLFSFSLVKRTFPITYRDWKLESPNLEFKWVGRHWIGRTEVTVGQFKEFSVETSRKKAEPMLSLTTNGWRLAANTWEMPPFPQGNDHPVVGISWHDAVDFCKWITKKERSSNRLLTNQFFRLPTVAEYRDLVKNLTPTLNHSNLAGQELWKSSLPWAWPKDYSLIEHHDDGYFRTAPVCESKDVLPGLGLCDLLGNVSEWSMDPYRKTLNLDEDRRGDPEYFDHDGDGGQFRAVLGASWAEHHEIERNPRVVRKAEPGLRTDRIGFRLVLIESESPPW